MGVMSLVTFLRRKGISSVAAAAPRSNALLTTALSVTAGAVGV